MQPIGHLHFRTVDSTRYEIVYDSSQHQCFYRYADGALYKIHVPEELFLREDQNGVVKGGGWAALINSKKSPNKRVVIDDPNIMVVLSTAFLYDDYVREIKECVDNGAPYPLKYAIKSKLFETNPPVVVDNSDGRIEIPLCLFPE
jgi:hypothetical protein